MKYSYIVKQEARKMCRKIGHFQYYYDLLQEGFIGLITAINRKESEQGFKSYARLWVRGKMTQYIETQTRKKHQMIISNDILVEAFSYYDPVIDTITLERAKIRLSEGICTLQSREAQIIERKWLQEADRGVNTQLANEWGVSCERVRQIEESALNKLHMFLLEY